MLLYRTAPPHRGARCTRTHGCVWPHTVRDTRPESLPAAAATATATTPAVMSADLMQAYMAVRHSEEQHASLDLMADLMLRYS